MIDRVVPPFTTTRTHPLTPAMIIVKGKIKKVTLNNYVNIYK